jgi:hypothetical protein
MGSSDSGAESSKTYGKLLAGTSLLEGFGQYSAGQAQASYTRSVYQTNAELANMQAAEVMRKGDLEAIRYGQKVQSLLGSQRARMAAAGIDISAAGTTAAELQKETLTFGYQDMQQIKNNAFREALGLKTQGKLAQIQGEFQAKQAQLQANMSLISGGLQAATSLYKGYSGGFGDTKFTDTSAAFAKAPTFASGYNSQLGVGP